LGRLRAGLLVVVVPHVILFARLGARRRKGPERTVAKQKARLRVRVATRAGRFDRRLPESHTHLLNALLPRKASTPSCAPVRIIWCLRLRVPPGPSRRERSQRTVVNKVRCRVWVAARARRFDRRLLDCRSHVLTLPWADWNDATASCPNTSPYRPPPNRVTPPLEKGNGRSVAAPRRRHSRSGFPGSPQPRRA
jgi:hypothetical protein